MSWVEREVAKIQASCTVGTILPFASLGAYCGVLAVLYLYCAPARQLIVNLFLAFFTERLDEMSTIPVAARTGVIHTTSSPPEVSDVKDLQRSEVKY